MTIKLNLLPSDYTLTGPVRQLIKVARMLNVILLALFIITALGMVGFFIFSSTSLKNVIAKNDILISEIKAQSVAQQQIVLLKNRLAQIKTINNSPGAMKGFNNLVPALAMISGDSFLSELNVNSQKITSAIVFKTNSGLADFLKSLGSDTAFSSITVGSFSYSPEVGYQVSMNFID